MSQAAQEANKKAGMSTGDQFEKLKADTAVDAVFDSMNRAFAQLEVAAALESNDNPAQTVAQLANNATPTLEMSLNTKQKVNIQ
jgi:hypothetical protein